ncbi:hypothetical protein, partial [Burkholderia contaminans]|uniref:hypothetical protein n=1 Tax=Burkholderia contaminans TaxID=488447 RepID=UPI001F4054AD
GGAGVSGNTRIAGDSVDRIGRRVMSIRLGVESAQPSRGRMDVRAAAGLDLRQSQKRASREDRDSHG